ncbi:hypothetical protein AAZX31_13G029400 [Glycine max]|uniref:RING-type E3 ubiquitin transferase n=3 Tax=Glycine subgen. Soja TaxID=1462606 RepID=I1LX65_SOYBN|nr:RING-H2 finger protein ATL54-like [Glycine max]XP_028197983.1 RING-H2 finger protein ATL54-like [Glycine soja]KAG4975904.1 hypothetical protein JHK86_035378 [Glycine max]KAG5129266.1 hypothetical protein JHK84_035663 [Glycine max]KAH1099759.1 hypothetical protein GYH30_035097 [Glycine max]KRH18169.1 hypothetical protein GLYMA_13G042300v4 [Glycine max]RZB70830.1 RING-H2 finger protein ATL54 [Glycine soja]|eukprot:NP_001304358.2 RING-H2 finger protein ATL54-like [Glycine max]
MYAFSLNMVLHHRKLLLFPPPPPPLCRSACPEKFNDPLPPPNSPDDYLTQSPTKNIKISKYLIISFSIVATAFIVLSFYAIYAKFFSPRNRSIRRTLSRPETEQDFLDEEEQQQHGPVVDHPIWYIRTTGLQQAVITAITVCKYRKDEGLIEGTDCSVCLSEFQEDESLRLLPKCNHAFHLPCIDTWLRSHTNCPMCRAPIVTDPTRVPSMDPTAFEASSFVEEVLENSVEDAQSSSDDLVRNEEEERVQEGEVCENENLAVTVQPRRSVSLDSSSAAKISLALATVVSGDSHGNHSKRVVGNVNGNLSTKGGSSSSSSSSSVKRSRSFNAKHLLSWYSRSQRKPNAPLRSF